MVNPKLNLFKNDTILLAKIAKALSHPARIIILEELAKKKECICGEIVKVLPLAQSTVSQHLKELKNAGLIKGKITGANSCYCINKETVEKIPSLFNKLFAKLNKNLKKNCE